MAKTIFKSSEKSNFILNMTEDQYAKLATFGLLTALFAVPLANIIPEMQKTVTYSASAVGLAVSGVICMILAMIALIKKYVNGSIILPAILFAGILGWGTVSFYNGYDRTVGFYGFPQRGEGLLAIIFYFCFFITAASIKRKKAVNTLLIALSALGAVNSLFSVIQITTKEFIYYSYTDIAVSVQTIAPDGMSQSPIFLSMVLCLSLAASLTLSAAHENKVIRIGASISAALSGFVMIFTRTLAGWCGLILGILAGIIALFASKKPKARLLSVAAVIAAAGLSFGICATVKSGDYNGYHLFDGNILWEDDAFQRASASGLYNPKSVEIDDTYDVYTYINEKTMKIIKDNKLYGTGPEQLVYPQLYTYGYRSANSSISDIATVNVGTFDKVYNEYLYTAATRGVPSLILLIGLLLLALSSAYKKFRKGGDINDTAVFLILICGILMFFITCSNITYSPVFWTFAGLACAQFSGKKENTPKEIKADKKNNKAVSNK